MQQRAGAHQDDREERHRGDRRGAVPPVVRGALRAAAGPQEGDEAERGRGGPHQQEALQEDREEVQGEAKGGKGEIKDNITYPDNELSQIL